MAFKEIAGKKNYTKYKECEPGDVLVEGVFLGERTGRYGVQYEFESDNGSIEVLNSAGLLNHKMQYIREGDRVKIIYDGSEMLTSGPMKGKDAHQFTVYRDDEGNEYSDEEIDDDNGLAEFDVL